MNCDGDCVSVTYSLNDSDGEVMNLSESTEGSECLTGGKVYRDVFTLCSTCVYVLAFPHA